MDEARIESYKKKNIFVLPFNEIEMFLIDEEIVNSVLSDDEEDKKTKKLINFETLLLVYVQQIKIR